METFTKVSLWEHSVVLAWAVSNIYLFFSLSLALSSIYVKNFFDENSKKAALDMTERIRQEISKDIQEIDWMDDETK